MPWVSRVFFFLVVTVAVAGSGCTRYGKPTPVAPTSSPLTTLDVNPVTGSDTTGNGSSEKPFKTLTKALTVVKNSTLSGLAIDLAPGNYNVTSGEKFPIIIPTGVTIVGSGFGSGFARGSFVNGAGEDTALEKLLGSPSGSVYATLEVSAGVSSVALNNFYVGVARFNVVPPSASYASLDVLGSTSASHASFGAGTFFGNRTRAVGIVVPSGSLSCNGCTIGGGGAALLTFSLPNGATAPTVTLGGQPSQSHIGGNIGVASDGTATVNASFQVFQSKSYGYQDSVKPLASPAFSPMPASVDFGGGSSLSQGGNLFINLPKAGVSVTLPLAQVYAEGNTWTPNTQFADSHGQYQRDRVFSAGASGKNVTILHSALGAAVKVGPIPPPSPSPSTSPTGSPGPTTSPT